MKTYKRILGILILINLMPLVTAVVVSFHSYKTFLNAYLYSMAVQTGVSLFFLVIFLFLKLMLWCFDLKL